MTIQIYKIQYENPSKIPMELVEVEFIPPNEELEFGKFYYSKEYQTATHLCVCGCGFITVTPIKPPKDWDIVIKVDGKFDLKGSVLQRDGCKSHYIITNSVANVV